MSNWKSWGGPLDESGAKWFVNRSFELEWMWDWASNIPDSFRSQALVGLRRTGKTAILHKIFNRLYHEQDKVLPVYISFGDYVRQTERKIDAYKFATEFFEGYLRSYLAFEYRQPQFHQNTERLDALQKYAEKVSDKIALEQIDRFYTNLNGKWTSGTSMAQVAIVMPSAVAKIYEKPTVVIIDEFQALTNVLDPSNNLYYDLTNFFQKASETQSAPLIVSGSSISMMVDEALTGALSGRFQSTHLEPLTQDYATDMIFRLAEVYNIDVTERQALEIWEATRGYPYSIECLLRNPNFPRKGQSEDASLDDFFVDVLTSRTSELREHYHEEFGKYISRLNEATRKVLLWIIKNPEKRIRPKNIVADLFMDEDAVRESLDQLYEGDIIRSSGWFSFEDPADPLLRQYIQHQHRDEVEELAPDVALNDLRKEINRIRGIASQQVGHLAEIIVAGVMDRFDGHQVDGNDYFGVDEMILLPKMTQIDRREGVIKKGEQNEIDVIGEYAIPSDPTSNNQGGEPQTGAWFVSVRYRNQKMGAGEVKKFIKNAAETQGEKQYAVVTRWYFSKRGFTNDAIKLLQKEGIYYNDVKQFNDLASLFGFLGLKF
ncbi:MAG: ATP-binding protein [Chloroflexota bacterium]